MYKKLSSVIAVLSVGVVAGFGISHYWPTDVMGVPGVPVASANTEDKPLYYRNPMNPAITSPVFMKDAMGMDYIPVYAEEPAAGRKEREVLFWRNPMNPAITSPVFARDEMGMDYLPVYADGADAEEVPGTVKIDPVTVQNIGVRTTKAQLQDLSRQVRAPGRITYDESRLYQLHPRTEGWIERLVVGTTGQAVKRGQTLLQIYSPQLVTAQEEFLLALEGLDGLGKGPYPDIRSGAKEMVISARQRLRLLEVPQEEIRRLERQRKIRRALPVLAPYDGIVTQVGVREGQFVTPKSQYYALADISTVWVDVDVYEYELPWIAEGDEAYMQLKAAPGQQFHGRVSHIFPYAEARTRTIKVRLEFANPELQLKPDMFADVVIEAGRQQQAVVVPDESVVRSGGRDQVFVVRGPGKFEPREVKLGISSGGQVQILAGIKADEEVVTSSLFLIDSESKLREATAKMMEAANAAANADDEMAMAALSLDEEQQPGNMGMGSDLDMGDLSLEQDLRMDGMSLDSQQGVTKP